MVKAKKLGLVGRCLLGAGLTLGAISLNGCNENYLMGAAAQGYGLRSGTAEGAASGAIMGEYFRSEGGRQARIDAAREGRTEVIIVNGGEEDEERKNYLPEGYVDPRFRKGDEKRSNPEFFTCKDWIDRNNDNGCDYEEFIGIKNIFNPSEGIKIISAWDYKRGKMSRLLVEDSAGEVVFSREELIPEDSYFVGEDDEKFWPKKEGSGIQKYTARWFLDDVFVQESLTEFYVDYNRKSKEN